MKGKSFAEKIFGAPAGSIVFRKPDLVLSHDNTYSINKTFGKMEGKKVSDSSQLMVVLDHNAPPTSAELASQYQEIRRIVREQNIEKFYDAGTGICHQMVALHARPGMLIVGSDSHTCTAGAFNTMAAGIDRTEAAGIWKTGESWFRVPESMKLLLRGKLREGVCAKDLSLWIIGRIGSAGANYLSVEFHGEGLASLGVAERMTLANLASEMGAKNAVFPADQILKEYIGEEPGKALWADPDASYVREMEINMDEVMPLVSAPHHVDHVKAVSEVEGTPVQQGLIGTCTNGRLEDLRMAASVLKGKKIYPDFQLLVIPASREIYLQAMEEGLLSIFLKAGANVLSPSCGPCLGTGQGIPANGQRVVSTANRNFKGRMGNKEASIYLASPLTVACSALNGFITHPVEKGKGEVFPFALPRSQTHEIRPGENRRVNGVWDYTDTDLLNTDQMFSGSLTYSIPSSDGKGILPHLLAGFDPGFAANVKEGDIVLAGENFGCGSSREHPAVGLVAAGVKAVIVKSVNRIFYRSALNQGLTLLVMPGLLKAYRRGDDIEMDLSEGHVIVKGKSFSMEPVPDKLREIIRAKGLVNYLKRES